MKQSVLSLIKKCQVCGTTYLPENGEICKCPDEDDYESDELNQDELDNLGKEDT